MTNPSPSLFELNNKVTNAIFRAERLPRGWKAQTAYRMVSELEEQIARLTTPGSLQGTIARRGAVAAAVSAEDWLRAVRLVEGFLEEPVSSVLAAELAELRDRAASELASRELPEVRQVRYRNCACRDW